VDASSHQRLDLGPERRRDDWFGDDCVETGCERPAAFVRHCHGGNGSNGETGKTRVAPHLPQYGKTVQQGHLDVQEEKVRRPFCNTLKSLPSVAGFDDLVPAWVQDVPNQAPAH
jgi:hypothetical protein